MVVLDDITGAIQLLPGPIQVLILIFLAAGMLWIFNNVGMRVLEPLLAGSGIDIRHSLSIGDHFVNESCSIADMPQCKEISGTGSVTALRQNAEECVYNRDDSHCNAIWRGKKASGTANEWLYEDERTLQGKSPCTGYNTCNMVFTQQRETVCAIYNFTTYDECVDLAGLNCTADPDYDVEMAAWDEICADNHRWQGGLYLLDEKLWLFFPLMMYMLYYILYYYQTGGLLG